MNQFQSENLDQLAPALVAMQADLGNVKAEKPVNTASYRYKYAELAEIRDHVTPVLAKHGFSIVQPVVGRRQAFAAERVFMVGGKEHHSSVYALGAVRTILLHSSGQWIAGEHAICTDWGDAGSVSGAITTARRYGLLAICGIAQDEDARPPAPHANGHGGYSNGSPPFQANAFDEWDPGPDVAPGGETPAPQADHRVANRISHMAAYEAMFPAAAVAAASVKIIEFPKGGLWGFIMEGQRKYPGSDLLEWFTVYGQENRYPPKIKDWSPEQASLAFEARRQAMNQSNGPI